MSVESDRLLNDIREGIYEVILKFTKWQNDLVLVINLRSTSAIIGYIKIY